MTKDEINDMIIRLHALYVECEGLLKGDLADTIPEAADMLEELFNLYDDARLN